MATQGTPLVPMEEAAEAAPNAVPRPWRKRLRLSSFGDAAEDFLASAGLDRGPWLTVAFAAGIGSWFALPGPWQWLAAIAAALLAAIAAGALWRGRDERVFCRAAAVAVGIVFALGVATIWTRSETVGAEPIASPRFGTIEGRVLLREEQPADARVRITLAIRDPEIGAARKVRINVPVAQDRPGIEEGAVVRMRVRLMPPSPPILPGAYDFARTAWFEGLAATGSVVGEVEILVKAEVAGSALRTAQRDLSRHVRAQVGGSEGAIAAAFASGDRGAIAEADEQAMRDSGLTHLLSISGLHVSAIIAAVYLLAWRILALWPWFALRVRIPIVAAGLGALAGVGYTLLTGAQVPTVRSCIAALLVLAALVLGREPLSLRMVAVAAALVLLLWPEALVGPSFQMSFAAVVTIVALHQAAPIKAFLAPREERWSARIARRAAMLLLTGVAIEAALTPLVLYHFHRAGMYGAFANVIAIPLVTFISMPLIAIALALDLAGWGAPAWWLAEHSLGVLLGIAHATAAQPGAVRSMPQIDLVTILLFAAGGLWLALWTGRRRTWGLLAIAAGTVLVAVTPAPDILVTRDGRDLALAGPGGKLIVLRASESSYARENLVEIAAKGSTPQLLAQSPLARCNPDLCLVTLHREARTWRLLVARNRHRIEERALASSCSAVDIVIADRWLPQSCRPKWLRIDRRFLAENGGVALYLEDGRVETVAQSQGRHGWWRPQVGRGRAPIPQ